MAVAVVWAATCGTITQAGVYTAPASGSCRVIATRTDNGHADTALVTVAQPDIVAGSPFGVYRLMQSTASPAPFTLSADYSSASTIVAQINAARTAGVRLMLVMTGGSHSATNPGCCLAVINGVLQFNRAGWDATLATFNTTAIRNAIALGVTDGTIIGATVMDEPYVKGSGDGNTWGPAGTMTKARVDSLCGEVKRYFPTLPAGVEHQHQLFEPTKSYRVCDFIVDQYNATMGAVTTWRDAGLAMGTRDHHAILFSLNVLDGGTQDAAWVCAGSARGTYSPNCRVTGSQLGTFGQALGPAGCGMFLWRFDAAFIAANQSTLATLARTMAATPRRACRRTP